MKKIKRISVYAAPWKNKKFRNMFFTYFAGICAVCLVIFFIYGTAVYTMYKRTADMELSNYSERTLGKTASIFNMMLTGLEQDVSLIQQNQDVADFLNMTQPQMQSLAGSKLKNALIDLLFFTTVEDPYIQSVYVYSYKNDYLAANTELIIRNQFYDTDWLDDYRNTGNPYFKARVRPNTYLDRAYNVLTYIKPIQLDGKSMGLVVVNVKYAEFAAAINQVYGQTPDDLYVLGETGNILCAGDDAMVNKSSANYPYISLIAADASRSSEIVNIQKDRITTAAAVGNYVIISSARDDSLNRYIGMLISTFVIGAVIGLAFSLLLAFLVSVRQYHYMVRLITVFPYPFSPAEQYNGEPRYVGHSVAGQIDGHKKIEQELTVKLTELKKAQAIALQAQINPHFLLNSLQYVNLDIMRRFKADTISTRIIALISDIFRNNLNTEEYLTDVLNEIANAKKYVQIITISENDDYHVIWDIDPSVGGLKTVRFILQPIMENCIFHGFENIRSKDKRIIITARQEDDGLLFKVEDNGKGMNAYDLEVLRVRLARSGIQEKYHIGLCNVDMRIRLIFGDKYGLTVDASNGEGMTVSVRMPRVIF